MSTPPGLLLALVGWVVALQNFTLLDDIVDGNTEGLSAAKRAHAIVGCLVMVVGLLQPLNAFVRPHPSKPGDPSNPMRRAWELLHKLSGRGATVLGIANVLIGCGIAKDRCVYEKVADLHARIMCVDMPIVRATCLGV